MALLSALHALPARRRGGITQGTWPTREGRDSGGDGHDGPLAGAGTNRPDRPITERRKRAPQRTNSSRRGPTNTEATPAAHRADFDSKTIEGNQVRASAKQHATS